MWCFCKALWHGLANLEWLLKKPWNDTWRLLWKSFWGRVIYWILFNQGIIHQEWVQVKIHRRMERSQGQSLHMPILILWIIWKIAEPQTTKMKRANNQGPTDAFSSGAFLCKKKKKKTVSNAEKPLSDPGLAWPAPQARWPAGNSQISPPTPDSTAAGVRSQAGLGRTRRGRGPGPARRGPRPPAPGMEKDARFPLPRS